MKVLQIVANTRYGGLPFHVLTLSRALRERGHEVGLLSMDSGPLLSRFREEGFSVSALPQLGQKARRDPLAALRITREVRRQIESAGPDIVHSHGPRAHFFAALAVRRLGGSGRNAIDGAGAEPAADGGQEQSRAPAPVLICSVHGSYSQFAIGDRGGFGGLRRRMQKIQYGGIDRLAHRYSSRTIAVCHATASDLVDGLGLDASRVVVVNNGIEETPAGHATSASLRSSFGYGDSDRVVVYVGRLAFHKGVADLVAAAELVVRQQTQARFLVIGEGPLADELRERAAAGPLAGKFVLAGRRDDAIELVRASDLFVLPSLSEGLPLSLLEAAMAGKAMVATDVGGIPDIVKPGETGSLVKPGDPAGLAEEMGALLSDDAEREAMGRAARKLWESRFTVPRMVDRIEQVYSVSLRERAARV